MSELKSVSECLPADLKYKDAVDIEDILDREVIVKDAEEAEGEYGSYLIMTIRLPESEEDSKLVSGGEVIKKRIGYLMEHNLLPVRATFRKRGRYYDVV